jgi:hypothetical protein
VPIESPQLDDLRFQQVADQLRRQIPIYAPEWTDHNESDPGLAMIQLFAHLAEQIGYRLNRLPDKAYLEFLKLVGVRVRPAEAARTQLAFYLAKPETATGFLVPEGARIRARSKATPPPTFETLVAVDAVPGQIAALVSTRSPDLRNIAAGTLPPADADTPATYVPPRFSMLWDGRQPKLKDWPGQPIPLFARPTEASHGHLWLGLAFNPDVSAGFVGQRVTLSIQLDDDEQPDALALADCRGDADSSDGTGAEPVEYVYYRPARPGAASGTWQPLAVLSDTTDGWTRSGQVRFDVPTTIGPIPDAEWLEGRGASTRTTEQICADAAGKPLPLPVPIPHPLVGAVRNPVTGAPVKVPVMGWIGVVFRDAPPRFALRALTFNAAPAIAATTVRNELLGRGTGRSDQQARLAHRNVLIDTLEIAVEDVTDGALHRWSRRDDFDTAGPNDRVFVLDPEAGVVIFGDGVRGQAPGLGMRIVAMRYRHGGGKAGELPVGTVSQGEGLPAPIQDVTNVVAARGGKDAETLDEARRRAPRELKTLRRAVTAEDFDLLARQTPGVRIARTVVVPLHRPYQAEGIAAPGLDFARVAPGVVSVVAVPDDAGLYPVPTEGALRTVCRHLDRVRLVTTEAYVVAPQYVRLFDLEVIVVAQPGYSRTQLRETIAARLEGYFHVLRGGADGSGFPFGGSLHHAELVAQVFRAEGVERVERLVASYDGHAPAPAGDAPAMSWRLERREARNLVGCPESALDDEQLVLFGDETVFVDTSSLNVIVR